MAEAEKAAKKTAAKPKVAKAAKKKTAKSKQIHGGSRKGAGRPKGSGTGPGKTSRIHRVVAMLSNDEFAALNAHAAKVKTALGTAAYQLLAKGLKLKIQSPKRGTTAKGVAASNKKKAKTAKK